MKRQHLILFSSLLLFLSLSAGAVGAGLTLYLSSQVESSSISVQELRAYSYELNSVWEKSSPAVLSVVALKDISSQYQTFWNGTLVEETPSGELSEVSSGTAFFVSEDGLALTNKHVVADSSAEYIVILTDGSERKAKVLAKDKLNDIAILQVEPENNEKFSYLKLADSNLISVGDTVMAIGNALGEYANTASAGIISATGRNIVAMSGFGFQESLIGLIQTDASINMGNSGGPLLDMNGEVLGMNTAIDTKADGIGFAIPSNDLALVLDSYKENGEIIRPFLGVRFMTITPLIQERLSLPVSNGALLVDGPDSGTGATVAGSSADKAGLQAGDIILSINETRLDSTLILSSALSKYKVGDIIILEVWRKGETLKVQVELERE